ncbi:prepilin peptidase [Streptomyces tsukubensis]|uniref:Prepilin peptidase n=2 Tax=Streptomyces TaxID=1883 RepID=A0A7G3UBB7_STRT9|nr:A24 family peptidase [Streptomyces tsukubensis]AZK96268.1 prepilin peptidase [Streptomyces tsukubensis]QKM67724.1 prepilin peptidase [Streptomyces tsukubensis NRRL18488]TAI44120.1 prepilin peptidase [Streptomyces tsukubensis]
MYVTLIAVAALWGAGTGLLVPRAVYRLAVEPDEAWRAVCPAGHPFAGPARGWVGGPGCGSGPDAGECRTRRAAAVPAAAGAVVCAVLAAATGPRPELAVWLLLVPFALVLALVDLRVHRLPDQLTLPLAAVAAGLLGAAAALPGAAGSWTTAALGGLALGAAYLGLFLLHPGGLGFGDVKLALCLGTVLGWYGWPTLLTGAFAGFLFGSGYGVGLMIRGRAGRRDAIPFGPFMMAGALTGLVAGAMSAAA